jgi:hypothetical protein
LEAIFHLPPLTCVLVELVRVSMKEGLIFSLKGIFKVGCNFSDNQDSNHVGEDGKQANP